MRFLIDASLSPALAEGLRSNGHDAIHLQDVAPLNASDERVLEHARLDGRVLVAADSDFGTILAATHAANPSLLYLRGVDIPDVGVILARITVAIPTIEAPLNEGSIVVMRPGLVRIRTLPIL